MAFSALVPSCDFAGFGKTGFEPRTLGVAPLQQPSGVVGSVFCGGPCFIEAE